MNIKNTFIAPALLLLGISGMCRADMLMTYNTTGVFNGGSSTLDFGDGNSITFDGITSTTISAPGNLSYGQFDTNGVGAATSTVPGGETFTLTVTQTSPTSMQFTDLATLTGTISDIGSTIHITFPTTTFLIGDDVFNIAQPDGGFVIVSPDDNAGITTINGTVALTGAPEPATMLLFGSGLISVATLLRRKRRA